MFWQVYCSNWKKEKWLVVLLSWEMDQESSIMGLDVRWLRTLQKVSKFTNRFSSSVSHTCRYVVNTNIFNSVTAPRMISTWPKRLIPRRSVMYTWNASRQFPRPFMRTLRTNIHAILGWWEIRSFTIHCACLKFMFLKFVACLCDRVWSRGSILWLEWCWTKQISEIRDFTRTRHDKWHVKKCKGGLREKERESRGMYIFIYVCIHVQGEKG